VAIDAGAPGVELSTFTTETTGTATSTAAPSDIAAELVANAVEGADTTEGDQDDAESGAPAKPPVSAQRTALVVGLVMVIALAGLVGWLGFRTVQSQQADEQRMLFLQVGRQGALNLTTIDWQQADTDVKRILDSATGTFYDDFSQRSQPFVDVVKQAQSKTVGTVTEAGLESETGSDAQVLVAVSVKTSNAGAPEQNPRAWRMRISVQKVDGGAKVSNVEFVP
jgi:Mce-associated membrane protein